MDEAEASTESLYNYSESTGIAPTSQCPFVAQVRIDVFAANIENRTPMLTPVWCLDPAFAILPFCLIDFVRGISRKVLIQVILLGS